MAISRRQGGKSVTAAGVGFAIALVITNIAWFFMVKTNQNAWKSTIGESAGVVYACLNRDINDNRCVELADACPELETITQEQRNSFVVRVHSDASYQGSLLFAGETGNTISLNMRSVQGRWSPTGHCVEL